MNARELLAEVQRIQGYAEGKPDYEAMLRIFGQRKADVDTVIRGFEMPLRNPFDTIDSYVATAESTLGGALSETVRQGLQFTTGLYFRSSLKSELDRLDFYNSMQENQIRNIETFQRGYIAKDAYARQQEERKKAFVQGMEDVKAIKELARLYAEAVLAVKKMEFLLK